MRGPALRSGVRASGVHMPDAGSAAASGSVRAAGASTTPSARPLERHARLGCYRICVEVASGGMATVYLARSDAGAGRDRFAALKVAHPHLARDSVFVEMFADEARLASRIHHPNVCRVLDFDREGPVPYLAMEYLDGENFASLFGRHVERLQATPPAIDLARHAALVARAMADACAGLHAAHELRDEHGAPLDVVHRDVSPENIFLTYDGVVKIVDFGVAQAACQDHRTSTGYVKGKLAYLQPEALEGKPLDRRADVWGIGVTLWELLTGERLFRREGDLETLRAITELEVRAPSEVRPGLPPALDPIVLRALARDRESRYPTTRQLARELLAVLAADGTLPDSVELAEWMDELFPGGRERSRRLFELGENIADDCAAVDEEDPSELEPTRRRACLPPPPPPMPSEWPISPRAMAGRRRRRRPTLVAAVLGACVGALGAWYALEPGARGAARPVAAREVLRPNAPTSPPAHSELLGVRESPDGVPIDLSRISDIGAPARDAPGQVAFEIGEETQEIVLRFRRASPAPSAP